jgi:hypothetical protein
MLHETDGISLTVRTPASLQGTFELVTARQGLTIHAAATRVLDGLPGLTTFDLKALKEPPREFANRALSLSVSKFGLRALHDCSAKSGLTCSSIFRKLLYAILITQEIRFICIPNVNGFLLQRTQMHFDFDKSSALDGPIPLLSRQHRENP